MLGEVLNKLFGLCYTCHFGLFYNAACSSDFMGLNGRIGIGKRLGTVGF
jgi:hypothetical protein